MLPRVVDKSPVGAAILSIAAIAALLWGCDECNPVGSRCSLAITAKRFIPPNPLPRTAILQGSATGNCGPFTYRWEFGDGDSDTSRVTSHTYAAAGAYTVTFTAQDANGGRRDSSFVVAIAGPDSALQCTAWTTDTLFCPGSDVMFHATASGGFPGYTYTWFFAHATVIAKDFVRHYDTPGADTARLRVEDMAGDICMTEVAVVIGGEQLNCQLTTDTSYADTMLNVTITGSVNGGCPPYRFRWELPDGLDSALTDSSTLVLQRSYNTPGFYSFHLEVADAEPQFCADDTSFFAPAPPPKVNFTASPRTGCGDLYVGFTDQSSGNMSSWLWDFGDGTTSSLRSPYHAYDTSGSFTVSLTVTGAGGSTVASKPDYIVVTDRPRVFIRGVLADPIGLDADSEAVWLTNFGGETVYLNGWYLQDASLNRWTLGLLPGEDSIRSGETIEVDRAGRGPEAMWLDNTGDTIVLVSADSCHVDTVNYGPQFEGDTAWFPYPDSTSSARQRPPGDIGQVFDSRPLRRFAAANPYGAELRPSLQVRHGY